METSEVVLEGTVLPGFAAQEVAATLAAMAKLNQDQALALLTSGKPRLARKGLSPETAQALAERFAAMGVAAFVRTALLNGLIMGGIPAGLSVLFLLLMSIVATGADARSGDGFEALGMLVLVAGPLILACLPMFALGPAIIYRAVRDIFYEAGEEGASGATHVS